jgi:5'-nucleotidase (lipoprotein e(P4) family)
MASIRRWAWAPTLAAILASTATGCRSAIAPAPAAATAPAGASARTYQELDALLWFQTAEEHRQIRRETFRAAESALVAALADPTWSAVGQGPEAAGLPPAVITDVDETLLDNSAFEGGLLRAGKTFNEADWKAWVEARRASVLPGALEFARFAAAHGVTIFYVTNRDEPYEQATRDNLAAAGFPLRDDVDVILLRGERPDWVTDKESRRRFVASSYRVLLQLGDDLNDFVTGVDRAPVETRRAIADAHAELFGTRWFVVPNPLYGSWQRALTAGQPKPADAAEALRRELEQVRAFP